MPRGVKWVDELAQRGIADRIRDELFRESRRNRGDDEGPRQLRRDRTTDQILEKIRREHPELPRSSIPGIKQTIDQQRQEVNRFNRWDQGEVSSPVPGKQKPGDAYDVEVVIERTGPDGTKYGGKTVLDKVPFTDKDQIEQLIRDKDEANTGPVAPPPPTPGFVDVSRLPISRIVIIDIIKR